MQGDFDGDGVGDVAIVAVTAKPQRQVVILVSIGGPSGGKLVAREIATRDAYLRSRGLFCSLPYPEKPEQACRLLFGAFHSEAEEVLPGRKAGRHL